MLKIIKSAFFIAIIIVLSTSFAFAEMGLIGGVGFPKGNMDYSIDGFFYHRNNVLPFIQIEATLHNSYASREAGFGTISRDVAAGYLLGRYSISLPISGLKPFIAAGGGIHFIASLSSDDSPMGGESKYDFSSKGHIFIGAEYRFIPKFFLTGFIRLTFPGDETFDAGYVGLGIGF